MKVWIVLADYGYEGYSVRAVCATLELANARAEYEGSTRELRAGADGMEVEEHEVITE